MVGTIRVLIVEDEKLMRRALSVFLRDAADIEVVGLAEDGARAIEEAARLNPDVVLMDIHMPVLDGISATRRILAQQPTLHVIALTTLGSVEAAVPMLQAGASGYLLKDSEPEALIDAIRHVVGGERSLSPTVTMSLLHAVADDDPLVRPRATTPVYPNARTPGISDAERDVLALLARGLNTVEMARELTIAEATVKSRLARLCSKFGVDGRVKLLIAATEAGLVTPGLDHGAPDR